MIKQINKDLHLINKIYPSLNYKKEVIEEMFKLFKLLYFDKLRNYRYKNIRYYFNSQDHMIYIYFHINEKCETDEDIIDIKDDIYSSKYFIGYYDIMEIDKEKKILTIDLEDYLLYVL